MASNNADNLQSIFTNEQTLSQTLAACEAQLTALSHRITDLTLRVENIERYLQITTTAASSTRPSAAGPKLVSIPELLEPILLHLPTRDLLLIQRVSKTFKQAVDTSTAIQRALFLAPEPQPTPMKETDVRINPLLADQKSYISIPLYNATDGSLEPYFMPGAGWTPFKARIAECEVLTSNIRHSGAANSVEVVRLKLFLARVPGTSCYGRADVGESVHGSWRKMYLTQPPIHPVWAVDRSSARGHVSRGQPPPRLGELWPWKSLTNDGTIIGPTAGE